MMDFSWMDGEKWASRIRAARFARPDGLGRRFERYDAEFHWVRGA